MVELWEVTGIDGGFGPMFTPWWHLNLHWVQCFIFCLPAFLKEGMTNNLRTGATCPHMRVAQYWSCFSNYPLFWMPQLIRVCTLTHIPRTIFSQTFRLLFSQNPMALQDLAPPNPSISVLHPLQPPGPGLTPALGRQLSQDRMYLFLCCLEHLPTHLVISKFCPSLQSSMRLSTMTASQGQRPCWFP
jgi:hypothetical protein